MKLKLRHEKLLIFCLECFLEAEDLEKKED